MVVLVRACGPGLGREGRRHGIQYVSAALSSAFSSGFALLGDSLFSVTKKVSKNACPCIRPVASRRVRSLRRRSEGRRTRAIHGPLRLSRHPCRSPLSTTAPLTLLKGRLVPPARSCKKHQTETTAGTLQAVLPLFLARDVGWIPTQSFPPQATSKFLSGLGRLICKPAGKLRVTHRTEPLRNFQSARTPAPVRRPSGGVAQGDARHGRRARSEGTGTSLRDGPRSGAGGRGVLRSKTRMSEWPSFWLLFLGQARKSDAPCKAQPVVRAEESAARPNRPPKPTTEALHPTQPPAAHPTPAVRHCTRPQ